MSWFTLGNWQSNQTQSTRLQRVQPPLIHWAWLVICVAHTVAQVCIEDSWVVCNKDSRRWQVSGKDVQKPEPPICPGPSVKQHRQTFSSKSRHKTMRERWSHFPHTGNLGHSQPQQHNACQPREINPGVCKADQYFIHRKEVENILKHR